ncbi:myosin light chain 2, putative, partial [Eimeria acervulina]
GYSPGEKDCASLPAQVDYKSFQTFLTGALHAEDLAESFQRFFSLFDIQATGDLSAKQLCNIAGDLSAKQLCNIVQMYGDEPLSKEEATKFTEIVMGTEKVLPINVVVDRIMEGQV